MNVKKFRVRKDHIYEDKNAGFNNPTFQKAALFGYAFVKTKEDYYMVSIKKYKTKPDCLTVELVELEVIEDSKLREVKHE